MPPNIQAQAAQSAAQGNQMLASDQSQAATAQNQYGADTTAANTAQNQVNSYANYMAGAGSGTNLYNTALTGQEQQLGYDPSQMTAARGNLNQATGALSAYSDYANQAASKFGLNAGGFAAANSGALSGLNNNIAAQQGVVNGLSTLYGQAQTGANQSAGLGVQGEQNTLGGYQDVYNNAASQQASALSNLQFFNQLASTQGGLNASMQQSYATAQAQYAAASQSMAQAAYLGSETTGQNLQNQGTQAQLAANAVKAQATAQAAAAASAAQSFKNQGLTQANTVGNASGQPVYSAQF